MKSRTTIRCARHPIVAALLLLAFCSRALIPVGFMPGPGGLVVCDGHGAAQAASSAHDMAGMDTGEMNMSGTVMPSQPMHSSGGKPAKHEDSTLCPFAAAVTAMATAGLGAALCVTARAIVPRVHFPPDRFLPTGTIVPTSLPRGPPLPT